MGLPDALLFAFLAIADALFLVYLRQRRHDARNLDRITRSLRFVVERENGPKEIVRHRPNPLLRRAS